MKQGKEYETTLLGRLLSVSCLTRIDGGSSAEFFDRPTRLSQPEVDNTESMIYQVSDTLLLFMSFLWKKTVYLTSYWKDTCSAWYRLCIKQSDPYTCMITAHIARMYRFCLVCACVCLSVCPSGPGCLSGAFCHPPLLRHTSAHLY